MIFHRIFPFKKFFSFSNQKKTILIKIYSARSGDSLTPLHLASYYGNTAIVDSLLSNGARRDFTERKFGRFPLHFAALGNHGDAVELLLQEDPHIGTANDKVTRY